MGLYKVNGVYDCYRARKLYGALWDLLTVLGFIGFVGLVWCASFMLLMGCIGLII